MKINFSDTIKSENGNFLFQYLCTITATLSVFTSCMHYAWPTPSLPKLLGNNTHIPVTDSEGSCIAILMLLGCPVGSIITFLIVDLIGRKKMLLLTSLPLITSWIMIAYAGVVEVIYTARFVAGIADGIIYTVIPIYLCEIADPSIRGLLGSSSSITNMMGILMVNIFGIFFSIRTSALISLGPPILFLVTFIWMPESPYFLIMINQREKAKESLKILTGKFNVDADIERLSKSVKSKSEEKINLLDLFKVKSNRKSFLIVIALRTFQQLSGYTAITFYVQIIFENISCISLPANIVTLIYFLIQCIITITSSLLLDRTGRKPLLMISAIGCAISLLFQAIFYHVGERNDVSHLNIIPLLCLILFIIAYCLGLGTIPTLMLGELFNTDVKAFALSLTEIYYGIIAAATSKFFQIVKDEFGIFIPFYVFASFCLISLIFIVRYIPETKGKSLEEIQEYLRGEETEQNIVKNQSV